MKRARKPNTIGTMIFSLIMVFAFFCACGVYYVMLKNKQVRLVRHIDKVQKRTDQHQMDIRTEQMRVDQLLDRYLIRERLRAMSSNLRPITQNSLVIIQSPLSDSDQVVAVSR